MQTLDTNMATVVLHNMLIKANNPPSRNAILLDENLLQAVQKLPVR